MLLFSKSASLEDSRRSLTRSKSSQVSRSSARGLPKGFKAPMSPIPQAQAQLTSKVNCRWDEKLAKNSWFVVTHHAVEAGLFSTLQKMRCKEYNTCVHKGLAVQHNVVLLARLGGFRVLPKCYPQFAISTSQIHLWTRKRTGLGPQYRPAGEEPAP